MHVRVKPLRDFHDIDKPRERIKSVGATALKERDLIAAIIGRGVPGHDVNAIATDIHHLLEKKGGDVSHAELMEIQGVGETKASQILAAFELARRYLDRNGRAITTPADVALMTKDIAGKKQEYFLTFTLNGAGQIIERRIITKGILNHSPVHPREVFAPALDDRAASVILVHNHPSGNPEPSSADIEITRMLKDAGDLLGISVLDHIIVTSGDYVSLKERGLL
ncbi:MAG TPA: DNA repair protein RadC [Methanoculleus sp.]|nr:DNA repair protein RadC [Methanoculleus sp.]